MVKAQVNGKERTFDGRSQPAPTVSLCAVHAPQSSTPQRDLPLSSNNLFA
jgi:hypothetical protein